MPTSQTLWQCDWLDENLFTIASETFLREDRFAAMRYIGLRIRQSPHLVPKNAYGFCVGPVQDMDKYLEAVHASGDLAIGTHSRPILSEQSSD